MSWPSGLWPSPAVPPDAVTPASERGRELFEGKAGCSERHAGILHTDAPTLHDPEDVPTENTWAARSATGLYRATLLRGLVHHAPYFHDGSAATLDDVVRRYDDFLGLGLTSGETADVVDFLETL